MNNTIFSIERDFQRMLNIVTIDISKFNLEDSLALLQAVPLYFNYTELKIIDGAYNILNDNESLLDRLGYRDSIAKELDKSYAKIIKGWTI